jgi:hypothetical protein
MLLYHGTNEKVARKALKEGIRPRIMTRRKSIWDKCPSRKDLVYLTDAYAPYFAFSATKKGQRLGIIEVDTDMLDEARLLPDEDFLENVSRGEFPEAGEELVGRTCWFRDNLEEFQHHWVDSLEGLGNVAYRGAIPPEAITRISVFDPRSNPGIYQLVVDPAVSVLAYQVTAPKYRALIDWFFGEEVDPEQLSIMPLDPNAYPPEMEAMRQQAAFMRERLQAALDDQGGLRIIENEAYLEEAL